MACTHRVDVVALHQKDVFQHCLDGHSLAMNRIDVMTVGSLEISEDSVDIQLVILELNLAETVALEGAFKGISLLVKKFHLDSIEIWILGRPKVRPIHDNSRGFCFQLFSG